MLYYSAYNLRIGSEIPLLELPPAQTGGDVDIRLTEARPLDGTQSIQWRANPGAEARFSYPRAGQFQVCGGREVIVTPEPGAESALLRLYVQGMMLAAILHQRGLFVLHASIVSAGGRCFAFVGSVGAGKSTMASGFHARGYSVVADDNAALSLRNSPPTVLPAFPSLKIYPEVAAALGYSRSYLRPVHESQVKHAQPVLDGFSSGPVPLDAIYVLDREAAAEVSRLSAVETMRELIRHSVPTRWGVEGDGTHLQMCAQLANLVPVYRVRTFHNLQEIRAVLDRILKHREGTRR
ncbi:MAG: hypothetical protein P4L56_16675 [Candidatus Sulfopaludibacter sp.]|nr:hypothetical protein [Candidatus Sulfopaludibacter sp.]